MKRTASPPNTPSPSAGNSAPKKTPPQNWVATPYLTALWLTRPETFQRRLIAGADIKLCPSASLNIYYMFKTAYPSRSDITVLGLGLTVSL